MEELVRASLNTGYLFLFFCMHSFTMVFKIRSYKLKTRFVVLVAGLLFFRIASSDGISWLAGAYVDTLNKTNIKAGVTFNEPYEFDEEKPYYYGGFKYADMEVGWEGEKISFGLGNHIGHGMDRIGLSYARLDSQDLAGIEAVLSQMGGSFKIGYYRGLHGTDNKWMLGIGLGF